MVADELYARHHRMVHALAQRLRREMTLAGDLEDLIAYGYGGLLEAHERFDPARGVRFQTFAYHRVRGAILDGVRRMAELPRRAHERRESAEVTPPTAAPRGLDRAFTRLSTAFTGPTPTQGRYGAESPEALVVQHETIARLLAALASLPPRERALLRGHYFEGRRLDHVADELGISKSWASRLHTQALAKLRATLGAS